MYNKAILIGRLTTDVELKSTSNGIPVASFRIAVDRRYTSRDGERPTDFLSIVAWRQNADFISKYFHKGDLIGIEGNIQTRNYEDKQGNKRTAVEIVVDNQFFVGGKRDAVAPSVPASAVPSETTVYGSGDASDFQEVDVDADLPF